MVARGQGKAVDMCRYIISNVQVLAVLPTVQQERSYATLARCASHVVHVIQPYAANLRDSSMNFFICCCLFCHTSERIRQHVWAQRLLVAGRA